MKVRYGEKKLAVGCALFALAVASTPVSAQNQATQKGESASSSNDIGNDIVVTAQGREQRLQDVAVSVSVMTGDTLVRSNIKSIEEVGARISNVRITGGTGADNVHIRGIGSGGDPGFEQAVGTFLDGVYRGRGRSMRASLFDIERIEVLKGPQGTFFGANASAGAINITSRKPSQEFSYNASALWGPTGGGLGYGEFNFEGGVTLPVNDELSVRLAGRYSGQDGWIENTWQGRTTRGPNEKSAQGRFSARWEPSSSFRSDFRFDILRRRIDTAFAAEVYNCPPQAPFTAGANTQCGRFQAFAQTYEGSYILARPDNALDYHSYAPPTYGRLDFYEAAWTNSVDLGSGSLRSITSYYDHRYWHRAHNFPLPVVGTPHGYNGFPSELGEDYNQFSQELRYESAAGGVLEYMFGAYYSSSNLMHPFFTGRFNVLLAANAPAALGLAADTPVTHHYSLEESTRNWSGFASATIRPIEGVRINLGLRYLRVEKRAHRFVEFGTSINNQPSTFIPFPQQAQTDYFVGLLGLTKADFPNPKRTDDKFLPSIGVQVDVIQDVMAYATYSKGFKGGGYGAISGAQLSQFDPESVNSYELGFKSQLFDRRLTLNMAAFLSDYKDLQESTFLFGPFSQVYSVIANVASARAKGVEFSATLRASDNATIRADIGYLDSRYRGFDRGQCTQAMLLVTPAGTQCFQNMAGKRRPYAPKWSGGVGVDFDFPMGEGDNSFRASPLLYFSSDFFHNATADPLIREPAYAKVDLRLGYGPSDRKWEVAVVGKNLTNRETIGQRQPLVASLGSVVAQNPEPGRSIAAQVSIRY